MGARFRGMRYGGNFLKEVFPRTPFKNFKKGCLLYNLVSVLAASLANRHRAVGTLVRYYELTYKTIGGMKKGDLLSKGDFWMRRPVVP